MKVKDLKNLLDKVDDDVIITLLEDGNRLNDVYIEFDIEYRDSKNKFTSQSFGEKVCLIRFGT